MPADNAPSSEHHPIPVRRLIAVFVVMTIGIVSLWILIEQMSGNGTPDGPLGTATVALGPGETPSPGRGGTPTSAEAEPRPGSLPDLLQYAPDRLGEGELPLTEIGHYADINAWMGQVGVPHPTGLDDPALGDWEAQLANLAIPASLGERGLDPVWNVTYGFSLLDLHQVLVVGHAPDYVMVMCGSFDVSAMQDAWVRNGYQAVEVEGTTIWSLFPEDAIDLSAPASRPSMGALNNVTLLPDGTLVAAARLSRLQFALRAVNGTAPSLAENEGIASMLESGSGAEQFVSAVIAKGELLEGTASGMPMPGATPVRDPRQSVTDTALHQAEAASQLLQMPQVDLLIIGIVPDTGAGAGGTPAPGSPEQLRMILSLGTMEDGRNAREAVTRRLAESVSPVTGTSYLDRFGTPKIMLREVQGNRAALVVDAMLQRGVGDWLMITEDRDLGFAMWVGPADEPDEPT